MKKPLLKRINKLDSIPLLSDSLKRLIELEDDNNLSTHELSTIILDDYGLINKVLQSVNAFYYNRLGKEINTVTQAVILLGFNTVKKIALSMAVLELMGENGGKATIEEIGKAFLAAQLAQAIGTEQGGLEPEEIFICTLFRHLPRIAMAIGNPELLSEIEKLESSTEKEDRLKAKRIIRNLGYKLAQHWKLPKTLAGYLEGCGSISGTSTPAYRRLAKDVSSFVNLWSKGGPQDELVPLNEDMVRNYGMDAESLEAMISRAMDETKRTIPAFREVMRAEPGTLLAQGTHAEDLAAKEHGVEAGARLQSTLENEMLFTELVQNLMTSVNSMETGLEQIYLLGIEILRRVIHIGNIIFCKVSKDRRKFSASFGMGDHAGFIRRNLNFDTQNGPKELQVAFQQERETLLYWNDLLEKQKDIPENLPSRQILLAPLVIQGTSIGCLILDKNPGERFEPGEIQKASIIRQLVVTATSLRAVKRTRATE